MNRIDTIKHNYTIRDLAEQFGANQIVLENANLIQ